MKHEPQHADPQERKAALLALNERYRLGLYHASSAVPHALTPEALAHEGLQLLVPLVLPAIGSMARRPRLWAALGGLGLLAGLMWQARAHPADR